MQNKSNKTSSSANWLISKFINDSFLEEFYGDLQEMYEIRIASKSKPYAKVMYWVDALHMLFGFTRIRLFKTQNNKTILLKNMLTMAFRSARKQKQFTILNLLGLTLGITTCLFIGLYVFEESTYDTFHEKGDRIYRVNQPMIWNAWDEQFASTGPNVAIALREEAPEFEEITRILSLGAQTIRISDKDDQERLYKETKYFGADENFFDVFSFQVLQGDLATALVDPQSIVITQETAERYFEYEDALNKFIEVKESNGEWRAYTVKAVIANVPNKSHLQFDMLVSFKSYPRMFEDQEWKWIWTAFSTYGLVREGTDIAALTEKIQAVPPKYAEATTTRIFNQSFEDFTKGNPWTLYLQPLNKLYLSSDPENHRFGPTGKPQPLMIFTAIGILILILSSINFMNLSTARSASRMKEIGVRKVLGSHRSSLIYQFIFESILFVALSTIFALGLVYFSLDSFNSLSQKELNISELLLDPYFIGLLISFVFSLGILAGSYPALYLSSFRPIQALKGSMVGGLKGKRLRNVLVVFQFTMSIALVICTFFVQRQLVYASTMNMGFDRENVLQIHNMEQLESKADVLKSNLASNPAVRNIGKSFATPANLWDGERYKAPGPDQITADMSNFRTEAAYLDLLGLEFIAGRNFDTQRIGDKYGVVLNERAVKALGWGTRETYKENSPIGKMVICAFDNEEELELLGIVKDFNYNSLKNEIEPLVIMHHQNDKIWNYGLGRAYLSIRIDQNVIKTSNDLREFIDQVEEEVNQVDPTTLFEYSFMDEDFEATFRSEHRMGKVLNLFSFMTVIIACLGLFGLAAFSAEQRMKELGIRKVLGARISALVISFSAEFTRLMLIAILLASPVAYFLVDQWLTGFAYRTPIKFWVFAISIFSALIIAGFTIGYQSLSAARKNPAEVLKDQ